MTVLPPTRPSSARRVNTVATPAKPKGPANRPESVNPADAVTVQPDGTAECKSAHGDSYITEWDTKTYGVTYCGCTGWYSYKACRHAVLLQLILDTIALPRVRPSGPLGLLSAGNLPEPCECGGVVVVGRWYALPLRGYVTISACAGCEKARDVR